ncbi:MAG: hypothetical protein HW390_2634 [Candidatus Brocadiaceae bacterium]|nr:hypothetical protein [Candidatus Brocadiaceae bacterium]
MIKTCKLCLQPANKLVKSHIIPKAFYEEFRKISLLGVSAHTYDKTYQNGIYGEFLCEKCEQKFNQYDEFAIGIFKQGKRQKSLHEEGNVSAFVVENVYLHSGKLHQFALSVLWRAAASGRDEYKSIKLGNYQERIRCALDGNNFEKALLDSAGLYFQEHRGGTENTFNQVFIPYKQHQNSKSFRETFGHFHCHDFGFPYGELLIRLGGEKPKQGFFDLKFDGFSGNAVLWTSNLSDEYPNLFFSKTPQSDAKKQMFRHLYKINRDSDH